MKSRGAPEKSESGGGGTPSWHCWENAWGWCGVAYTRKGIRRFTFGEEGMDALARRFAGGGARLIWEKAPPPAVAGAVEQIDGYFDGLLREFSVPLDLEGYTDFTLRVWEAVSGVPYGGTVSYGELARKVGAPGAARAVGRALGANPAPVIIPCHRVIRKNGGLGGFSRGAGWKTRLLEHERKFLWVRRLERA
ncbi:MAG: methylated-DNA--[protein]-cysteine S-methyltransferase [bacterium]